jgi:hypothetical protein
MQAIVKREVKNPTNIPFEFTQGTNMPMEKTPHIGPFRTPPMTMAASSIPGRYLMTKVKA